MTQDLSAPTGEESQVPSSSSTALLQKRWLLSARVGWIVLTFLVLTLNVVMIPRYAALLQTPCQPGTACFVGQTTPGDQQFLHQAGISLGFVAAYQVTLTMVVVVVPCALAALIFWRRSSDWMALFCAFMLVLFGGVSVTSILLDTLAPLSPVWYALIGILYLLGQSSIMVFFLLFPSGRFVPRWTRWVALLVLLYWIYALCFTDIYGSGAWSNPVFFALILCLVGVQVYRYRRVSTPRERQQTRWVVFGVASCMLGLVLLLTLGDAWLPPALQLSGGGAAILVIGTGLYGLVLLIPLSIAIAILRSHLYDIDTLINKALVYGSLTGLLGALYAGLIIGLETLVGLFGGTPVHHPVVLVVSTLAIFALFLPARSRVQSIIDRRFYRGKYDAEKTLAAFSVSLGQEVNLEQLREDLLAVVQKTMEPAYVSLWLPQPERFPSRQTNHVDGEGPAQTRAASGVERA